MFEFLGLSGHKKTEVLLLRDRDKRFERVKIINETDTSLESAKGQKGITRHFIKRGTGYMEKGTGKTIFFAFEAGGHTADMEEGETTTLSLPETMREVLGSDIWEKVTPEIKEKLEHSTFGIVIEPAKTEKTRGIGNESRHTESDEHMIDYFAEKVHKALKTKFDIVTFGSGIAFGGFLVLLALVMKWIKL